MLAFLGDYTPFMMGLFPERVSRLRRTNPFHYLTELQNHAIELAKNPAAWMPWNYRQTLPPTGTSNRHE